MKTLMVLLPSWKLLWPGAPVKDNSKIGRNHISRRNSKLYEHTYSDGLTKNTLMLLLSAHREKALNFFGKIRLWTIRGKWQQFLEPKFLYSSSLQILRHIHNFSEKRNQFLIKFDPKLAIIRSNKQVYSICHDHCSWTILVDPIKLIRLNFS